MNSSKREGAFRRPVTKTTHDARFGHACARCESELDPSGRNTLYGPPSTPACSHRRGDGRGGEQLRCVRELRTDDVVFESDGRYEVTLERESEVIKRF